MAGRGARLRGHPGQAGLGLKGCPTRRPAAPILTPVARQRDSPGNEERAERRLIVGVFTESAVHLRDEIVALRRARAACRQELERMTRARQLEVSKLLGAFAGDLEGARRAWFGSTPAPAPPAKPERQSRLTDTAPAGTDEQSRVRPPEPAPKSHLKKHKKH